MPPHLLLHHVRVADHRAQGGAFEQAPLRRQRIPVIRIEREGDALPRPGCALAVGKPLAMHAIARAVDVAAGDALVRLYQVEAVRFQSGADGSGKAPVAPHATNIEWVAADHAPTVSRPRPARS